MGSSSRLLALLGLFSLSCALFLGKSWETSLQALDSTTHALIALDTSRGGALPVLPMRNLDTNLRPSERFNDHPFPLFFLNGKIMRALGPDAWSARLLPGAFSVGCVILTVLLGASLFSFPVGLLAGLITLLSRDFLLIGSRFHLDTPMVFFILLSFLFWVRNRPAAAGLAAGFGIWMKSPVALLLFPSVLLAELFQKKNPRAILRPLLLGAGIAVLTGTGVWILTGFLGGWELVTDYFSRQVLGTAVGGRGSGAPPDLWLGLSLLKRNHQPWIWLLGVALLRAFFTRSWKSASFLLVLSAALVLEGVMAVVSFKHWWYFVPVYPFLALLCAAPFQSALERRSPMLEAGMAALGMLVLVLLLILPIPLGPEDHPGLRKLSPFIQSHGTASDRVLWVDGEQPFGSDLNSIYELAFYTDRRILQSVCHDAEKMIRVERPEWIVITGKNRVECLPGKIRESYPVEWNYGGQHLLGRGVSPDQQGDLTPLIRELRPPRNGLPLPLPSDPYFPKPWR